MGWNHVLLDMASNAFEKSYLYKLGFYLLVLALPLVLMTLVEMVAAGSAISATSQSPSKFLMFLVYFLPGIIMAKRTTDSLRRTIGVTVAYILVTPAYYLYAVQMACTLGNSCVAV